MPRRTALAGNAALRLHNATRKHTNEDPLKGGKIERLRTSIFPKCAEKSITAPADVLSTLRPRQVGGVVIHLPGGRLLSRLEPRELEPKGTLVGRERASRDAGPKVQ